MNQSTLTRIKLKENSISKENKELNKRDFITKIGKRIFNSFYINNNKCLLFLNIRKKV